MRPLDQCRLARADQTVREALLLQSRPGRRTGAVMIVDERGRLCGIFTDSDLAKLLEARRETCIDGPISDVMTRSPSTVEIGTRLVVACQLLADRKISELPVVDPQGRPVGLIDITDVWNVPIAETKEDADRGRILKLHRPVYRDPTSLEVELSEPHQDFAAPDCRADDFWD